MSMAKWPTWQEHQNRENGRLGWVRKATECLRVFKSKDSEAKILLAPWKLPFPHGNRCQRLSVGCLSCSSSHIKLGSTYQWTRLLILHRVLKLMRRIKP